MQPGAMNGNSRSAEIVLLPGDGIGPEVVAAARTVLEAVSGQFNHTFRMASYAIGGNAIDAHGTALPEETLAACRQADAILLGAVGGPRWDNPAAPVRPEQGLLGLRKALDLFGNLRPVRPYPELAGASPLRPEFLAGVDLLVVRELTGDVYFGEPRLRRQVTNGQGEAEEQAIDTMSYTEGEVRRVAHLAFRLARGRRRKVTSVDKANVLESSRLWRQVVTRVAGEYSDVQLEHLLVDAAAMFLLTRPASFDVLLTGNLFGDILTDETSVLSGSMGLLPSASLGDGLNSLGLPRGLYEPIHGSAPDIAGKGIANPAGAILSAALLLRHSLGLEAEARAVEAAVEEALVGGQRTRDLDGDLPTRAMTETIVEKLQRPESERHPVIGNSSSK
ncbi:MAG TPA: 3-isopropylmalate dehydrogenase [Anaerolineales bacterium]